MIVSIVMAGLAVMMPMACHEVPWTLFLKMALMVMVAPAVTYTAFSSRMCANFSLNISKRSAKKHSCNSSDQPDIFFHHNSPVIRFV